MYVVTWRFKGLKCSKTFASSAGADRYGEWLRTRGGREVKGVKVKPVGKNDGLKHTFTAVDEADCWAAVDADKAARTGCTRDCFCNCNGSCVKD